MPCEVETRLSRPTSAARLLPTISSPSLEDEGRNPVGRNDAARAARFAWMSATHAGRPRVKSKQLRDSLSGAHVADFEGEGSGERSGRMQRACLAVVEARPMPPVIESLRDGM